MIMRQAKRYTNVVQAVGCVILLLSLSACQSSITTRPPQTTATLIPTPTSPALSLRIPSHSMPVAPTPSPTLPTSTPTTPAIPTPPSLVQAKHPVMAFYYGWYNTTTWCSCTMSDLPTIKYNSDDESTIDRQLNWAIGAGITGFISSWWGANSQTDKNFARLLAHAATREKSTHIRFASTIYFESNAPDLNTTDKTIQGLRYISTHYSNDPHFFHWQEKPVIFIWKPLDNGRTLDQWAKIRQQVDPNNQMLWSAESASTDVLSVFDGIHLFSGGYWGLQNGTMTQVDQGFRNKINAYNQAHGTQKIWAAGVLPGYDDTRVPGRTGTYTVPRNNGSTYQTSWTAAIASNPEWVTITSFNEYFEGSTIEPSQSYANQYLNITQQYTQQWQK